jgi:hypothetical protein
LCVAEVSDVFAYVRYGKRECVAFEAARIKGAVIEDAVG